MSKRYTLTRTSTVSGKVHTFAGLTLREVGQAVYFCAFDNLMLDHKAATEHGMAAELVAKRGEAYHLGGYTFTTEAQS